MQREAGLIDRAPKLTAARWCSRCGGKHRGACDLVPLYGPAGQPPRSSRREIAELVEDYEDERADYRHALTLRRKRR